MKEFDDILAWCLDNIESGEMTLEECARAYPEHAAELTELVHAAEYLRLTGQESSHVSAPSPMFKSQARERLFERISAETPQAEPSPAPKIAEPVQTKQSWWASFQKRWLNPSNSRRPAWQVAFALIALLLFASTGTATYASTRALPGETLYPIKTSIENARLNRAADTDSTFIDLQLKFANERLEEIEQLVTEEKPDSITTTSENYAQHLQETLIRIASASSETDKTAYKAKLDTTITNHNPRLDQLEPAVQTLSGDDTEPVSIKAATKAVANSDNFIKTGVVPKDISRLTLMDIVRDNEKLKGYEAGLKAESMQELLMLEGPYTVFVPSDEAIANLAQPWEMAMRDNTKRRQTLLFHIIEGEYDVAALQTETALQTELGTNLNIAVVDGEIVLNGVSRLTLTDIQTDNGIMHYIDVALIPPPAP